MTATMTTEAVVDAGTRWCRLVSESEVTALGSLLSPDFTFRRADGRIEDRATWLAAVADSPRRAELAEPSVRTFDSVAVLTFHQRQRIPCTVAFLREQGVSIETGPDAPDELEMLMDLEALQVWTRTEGGLTLARHEEWLLWGYG